MIILIVATDKVGLIGNRDKLPWHIPAELKHFRDTTLNKNIVFGRRTFESVGLLKDRKTFVLSNGPTLETDMLTYVDSVESILARSKDEDFYIAGGSKIYELFLPHADEIILTEIQHIFEGDVYFPEWDKKAFGITRYQNFQNSPYNYDITYYKRLK